MKFITTDETRRDEESFDAVDGLRLFGANVRIVNGGIAVDFVSTHGDI